MRLRKFLLVIFTGLISLSAFSQTKITGTVQSEDGTALSQATVKLLGSSETTTTDAKGNFALTRKSSKNTLIVSYVGYETENFNLSANQKTIIIKLKSSLSQLTDVVVVGYGTQRKKDLTGSISSINSDNMTLGGTVSNIAQAIQGRAAGVQVQQSDFSPGGSISIVIRGGNSINTTNEPLYVVDGLISDNGKFISPSDIEDIQILKDASATAIYGARGGNGVILITTKKGKSGKMQLEADVTRGTQNVSYNPLLITGAEYVATQNAIAAENGKPPLFSASLPVANTNWFDAATQPASILNSTISFSGNDKNSKLYMSGNYFKQEGVLKSTNMERYSVRMGAEKRFSDRVKVGANFYGASTKSNLQRYVADITAPLYGIYMSAPNLPVYNANGSYYKYLGKDNTVANILEPTNTATSRLINGNMFLDYDVLKNLTYHVSGGAEYTQRSAGQYIPKTLTAGAANGGIAQAQMNTNFRWLAEQYLTYKYTKGIHAITALVGSSSQKDVYESLGAGSSNFSTDLFLFYNLYAGANPTVQGASVPSSSRIESKLSSYYGRLNYSYNDKLLATFTMRDDASSRFGPNNRHGLFPSGALAWKLTNESFIQKLNTFSNFKLRASYGITGNDRIGDYAFLSRFSSYGTMIGENTFVSGIEPASLSNNNLKWETTYQTDLGLDLGFVGGKVNVTIDLYKKTTKDLLLSVPVGQWWGFSSQLTNAGSIENKGIEISINTEIIKKSNFSWNTTFNIAYNKQKTLELANNVKIISTNTANPSGVVSGREFTRIEPGKELGMLYGFIYKGVIKTGETYAPQPNAKPGDPKYADLNGDGKLTPDDRDYMGNTNPRFVGGFGNNFQYKGFDLDIFFQGAFDYSLYNMNRLVMESTTSTDVLNRWVAGKNESTDIPREGYFKSIYGSYVNSRFVENASYIRLKSISFGYNLPVHLVKKINFIDGLRVYASGQNLLTFTKYTGTDPEVNTHSGSNVGGGIDFNAFPAFKTLTVGVKLTIH